MLLNAESIFNKDYVGFSNAAGIPESSDKFYKKYILPAFEKCFEDGSDFEAAYGEVISDYQHDGFIAGFKAAVQLLLSCAN